MSTSVSLADEEETSRGPMVQAQRVFTQSPKTASWGDADTHFKPSRPFQNIFTAYWKF